VQRWLRFAVSIPNHKGPHDMTTNANEVLHLSTDTVPRDLRFDYWSDVLSQSITPMSVESSDMRNFSASLSAAPMGALSVMEQRGSAHESHRGAHEVSRSTGHSFHLMLSLGSGWDFRHRGEVHLRRHDLMLSDSRYVHDIGIASDYHFIHLKLPPAWLRTWVADTDRLIGRRIPHDGIAGRALSNFVARLSPGVVQDSPLPGQVMSDQVGALLAMAAGEHDMRTQAHETLQRSIADVVSQRSAEPGLCAADVAQTLNIPVRLVHEALAARGCGFAVLLLHMRKVAAGERVSPGEPVRLAGPKTP
jgi:hypothetical protein